MEFFNINMIIRCCHRKIITVIIVLLLLSVNLVTGAGNSKFVADFTTDPVVDGWDGSNSYPPGAGKFDGEWVQKNNQAGRPYININKGSWQTPPIAVTPFSYYHICFSTQSLNSGFYVVRFFDDKNREIVSDDYNSYDLSEDWRVNDVFTQARENAVTMRVAFIAGISEARISAVSVLDADAAEVTAWNDKIYATLPSVKVPYIPELWKYMATLRDKLNKGDKLRVVVLGDSIANDMSNSQFHLMIQQHYPGSQIPLFRSIRGGTGCTFYQYRVREYVTDKNPDLVIIAGVSHNGDADAVRNVIEQIRRIADHPVAIMVLTGAIMELGQNIRYKPDGTPFSPEESRRIDIETERKFYTNLVEMRDKLSVSILDMRTIWEDYLVKSGKTRVWYQRDPVHGNSRGKQILGRIMEQIFSQDKDENKTKKRE